ncbi:MAG: hypothetical protein NC548_64185, partial [Lachnospiraceae bacterium]|nr:hypothetical protein [Lachnospiraceae bacterium]
MEKKDVLLWLDTREGENGSMELTARCLPGVEGRARLIITGPGYEKKEQEGEVSGEGEIAFPCPDVELWDPEHPRLYQVSVSVEKDGVRLAGAEQKIGFRTLERKENLLLWNHRPLKLKGICYRERKGDLEGTRKDLELFAAANINFLRSIYAPFSGELLSICDEMGFLVENTAPFYDVGDTAPATQDLPHLKEGYLSAVREMTAVGSHTSVAIWSLGHDCVWGANFRAAGEYLRSVDPVRPLTFHLPMSVPQEDTALDIWPVHYIDWQQPFDVCYDQMVIFHTPGAENEIGYMTAQAGCRLPVLHEAWSPVACHNRDEIDADPYIRKFWGESIRRFAEKAWETSGCLGGAVLAGVDEDGSFEGMGKYEWGILDKNHEPKPEYGELREAYAPIAVKNARRENDCLVLEVENRFLFTDLSECKILLNGKEIQNDGWKGAPGSVAACRIRMEDVREAEIGFVSMDGMEYASFLWEAGEAEGEADGKPETDGSGMELSWEKEALVVSGGCFSYRFDRKTCLLTEAYAGRKRILAGGPYLNSTGLLLGEWEGTALKAEKREGRVQVTIEGSYKDTLSLCFILLIAEDGTLHTFYEVKELFRHMPHRVKAQIGMAPGGLNEKGVAYLLPGDVEAAQDGAAGAAADIRICGPVARVRMEEAPWYTEEAMVDDRDPRMVFSGNWLSMDDYCGDYCGTETMSRTAGDSMSLKFTGTGVRLYGPLDINYGMCDVYLDGELIAENVDQYPDKVDLLGASRGYEKRYNLLL